ncbi:hypothetical protein [Enterococcus faecalis]|uniref:hypothetical protein n=1 Tax=Enterococcus faecalis TaxID=1351 RepID=UPI003516B2DE
MIKFILVFLLLIPLVFLNQYWLVQFVWILVVLLFLSMFSFNYIYIYISYIFGVDLVSYLILLLRLWICSLMVLASQKVYYSRF